MRKATTVFSDVDGTLLTDQHLMTASTLEAIRKLQNRDIPFYECISIYK